MAKPIRRYSRYSLRRNRRTRLRLGIRKGIIHVQVSFSNTIVTITDGRGRVVVWASAGACGGEGEGRPGVDNRASEFQTESRGSENEIDNACASNADCGKDWHQEPPVDGKKFFYRMIGRELRSLLSLLLALLRGSCLGWWKSFLWRLFDGTLFYLTYRTKYILPILFLQDFFEAIWESVKDLTFTLDSVSFRKRILKFLEVYSLFQLNRRTRIESMYSNTPQPPIRVRVANYLKFMFIFLTEYKTYSGFLSKNKFTHIILRVVVGSVYWLFFYNRVKVLPQSIKIQILILSALNSYLKAHSQFEERGF